MSVAMFDFRNAPLVYSELSSDVVLNTAFHH